MYKCFAFNSNNDLDTLLWCDSLTISIFMSIYIKRHKTAHCFVTVLCDTYALEHNYKYLNIVSITPGKVILSSSQLHVMLNILLPEYFALQADMPS